MTTFELPAVVAAAPAYVASLRKPLGKPQLNRVRKTPGVAALGSARVKTIRVHGPQGSKKLRLGAVDPLVFRSVTSRSIRDAEFVWTALMSDRAVMTFDAAKRLELREAEQIAIRGLTLEVGVLIEEAMPDIADVLISTRLARRLGMGAPNILVVGAEPGASIKTLGKDLKRGLPGARLRRADAWNSPNTTPDSGPTPPMPADYGSGSTIGTMAFRILPNGFIEPVESWVAANITTQAVPILGAVTCHRIMFPQLAAALGEIQDRGFASRIRPDDHQGCYVPRFIERDPRRGLSMHAFGLAIDLNASTNAFGGAGDMHPEVVRIFERWGFDWGGRWSPPDPMHFELARIVSP